MVRRMKKPGRMLQKANSSTNSSFGLCLFRHKMTWSFLTSKCRARFFTFFLFPFFVFTRLLASFLSFSSEDSTLEFLPSSGYRLNTTPRSRTVLSHQLWLKGRLQLEIQRGAWGQRNSKPKLLTPNFLKVQSQGKDKLSLKSPQAKAGEGDLIPCIMTQENTAWPRVYPLDSRSLVPPV